nr:MAG TPA: hypothetical protein [Caudoviricetes sp.]
MPYFYGPSLRSKTSRLEKSKLPYLNEEGFKSNRVSLLGERSNYERII